MSDILDMEIEITDKCLEQSKCRKLTKRIQLSMLALRHFNYKRAYTDAVYFVACICCISTGIARPRANLAPLRPITFVNSEWERPCLRCISWRRIEAITKAVQE